MFARGGVVVFVVVVAIVSLYEDSLTFVLRS